MGQLEGLTAQRERAVRELGRMRTLDRELSDNEKLRWLTQQYLDQLQRELTALDAEIRRAEMSRRLISTGYLAFLALLGLPIAGIGVVRGRWEMGFFALLPVPLTVSVRKWWRSRSQPPQELLRAQETGGESVREPSNSSR